MRLRLSTVPERALERSAPEPSRHGRLELAHTSTGRAGLVSARPTPPTPTPGRPRRGGLRLLGRRARRTRAAGSRLRVATRAPTRTGSRPSPRSRWSVRSRSRGSRRSRWGASAAAAPGSGATTGPTGATVTGPIAPTRTDRAPRFARSFRTARAVGTARGRAARRGARSRASTSPTELLAVDVVRAAYLAALAPELDGASTALGPGSGPAVCAHGGEEERSWSRPAAPRPRGRALRVPDRAGPGRDVVDGRRPRPARARDVARRRPDARCSRGGSRTPSVDALRASLTARVRLWYVPHAIGRRTRECRWRSSARTGSGARSSPPT